MNRAGRGKRMQRRRDVISVIEAAYAVERPEGEWLDGILAAADPELGGGHGVCAYVYDLTDRRPIVVGTVVDRGAPVLGRLARAAVAAAPPEYIAQSWRALSVTAASAAGRFE